MCNKTLLTNLFIVIYRIPVFCFYSYDFSSSCKHISSTFYLYYFFYRPKSKSIASLLWTVDKRLVLALWTFHWKDPTQKNDSFTCMLILVCSCFQHNLHFKMYVLSCVTIIKKISNVMLSCVKCGARVLNRMFLDDGQVTVCTSWFNWPMTGSGLENGNTWNRTTG